MRFFKSKLGAGFFLIWCVFFLRPCWKVHAQGEVYFDHITTEEGLSQNDVNCIYQDNRGFMWFGTHDGLNKYDGYDFTTYKPDANKAGSISSNLIYSIDGDREGNLWIGTTGSGLSYFNPGTEQFTNYKFQPGNDKSLSNDYILEVFVDSKNRLWVGTNEGLNLFDLNRDPDKRGFIRFNPGEVSRRGAGANIVYSVFEDSRRQLWVGTQAGLCKLTVNDGEQVVFNLVDARMGSGNFLVRDITEDKFGRLIIASGNGLYCQVKPGATSDFVNISTGTHLNVLTDDEGNIWSGTNRGLLQFAPHHIDEIPKQVATYSIDLNNPRSLNKNVISSLHKDRTGIVWIGTNGGGVNKFDPQGKQFRHFSNTLIPGSLSYNKIRAIFEDSNGTTWIGTEGGGLNMQMADNNDGTYNNFKSFNIVTKPFAIAEIKRGSEKILLVGSENTPSFYKLDISNPGNISEDDFSPITEVVNSVFTILEDHRRNVWVGTYKGGVYKWAFPSGREQYLQSHLVHDPANPQSISNNIIRNIYEDSDGNIWFGTGEGLSKLAANEVEKDSPLFVSYKNIPGDTTSLSHSYILALHESKAGDLWIGTFGGGLNKYIPGREGAADRFISFSEADGLPNNVIKGILEDELGYLWLSTNKGLSRFDPEKETFKNYDVNDGLQSNEFQELACYKKKDGEMLLGGINGFNAFYPQDITDNPFEAETVITDFLILNKPVKIGERINGRVLLESPAFNTTEINLKYRENSFSFEFAALHFAAPRKNKFAYKLEGFNDDWIYTGADNRFATYTNLSPGNYTLKVKASNNDGIWDSSPATVKIIIIPPWYRTTLAYIIYGLLILGLLLAFQRYTIIRTTEKHQLMLEHMEKEQSEELQRSKLEFFTNISHELRTPLTLIKGPLEYLLKNDDDLKSKQRQQQYMLMRRNANYLIRLVNQLLDFRKIDRGKMKLSLCQADIVNFVEETTGPFLFLANKKNIEYTINAPGYPVRPWFDPDAMEKIINNLLSNAFKFTPENGAISVEIKKSQPPEELIDNKAGKNGGDWVLISVKDTGGGIPPDKIDHIFDRFYVDNEKNTNNKQGVGIGLSFTKSLVELHKGKIWVDSEVGRGSEFTVGLPLAKDLHNEGEMIEYHNSSIKKNAVTGGAPEIAPDDEFDTKPLPARGDLPVLLVVDDNADIRSFIKQGLAGKYSIYQAENGARAFEVIAKVVPDIIICDIMMPVMDGIEFCTKIKSDGQTSHIPVILLTAKTTTESELEGLKTGADDYLKKPFDMEVLEVKIGKIVGYREELRKRFKLEMTMEPAEVTVTSADEQFLKQAMDLIEDHMMDTDFNVEVMVKELGLSRSNLYLKFKELTGLSSSEFIRSVRLKRAVQLLEKSDLSVKEVMYMTGFNTASYFSKCFKRQFGIVPSDYVRQTQGINA